MSLPGNGSITRCRPPSCGTSIHPQPLTALWRKPKSSNHDAFAEATKTPVRLAGESIAWLCRCRLVRCRNLNQRCDIFTRKSASPPIFERFLKAGIAAAWLRHLLTEVLYILLAVDHYVFRSEQYYGPPSAPESFLGGSVCACTGRTTQQFTFRAFDCGAFVCRVCAKRADLESDPWLPPRSLRAIPAPR